MKIKIRLMGMLKDREPSDNRLEITDGSTIEQVLTQLEIDTNGVFVFTVNGDLERDKTRVLQAEDDLTVLPPALGG